MRNILPDMFAVGEYWAPEDLPTVLEYIKETDGRISLFDASLQHNFFVASNCGDSYDLSRILADCLLEQQPALAVTLVGNHDTQPLQLLESPVQAWFKPLAYALMLLQESGYPCVFYPDLYGAHYSGMGNDGNEHEVWLEKCDPPGGRGSSRIRMRHSPFEFLRIVQTYGNR